MIIVTGFKTFVFIFLIKNSIMLLSGDYCDQIRAGLLNGGFTFIFLVSITELTLNLTIPTFNDPEEKAFLKHCGKRRKCW